jgi:hypothetical protein
VLNEDAKEISSGSSFENSSISWGDDRVVRKLGYFLGEQGSSYKLILSVNEVASELSQFDPRLQVIVDPMGFQGDLIRSQSLFYLAILTLSLSVFLGLLSLLMQKRK